MNGRPENRNITINIGEIRNTHYAWITEGFL
jgi:hypothetical protein